MSRKIDKLIAKLKAAGVSYQVRDARLTPIAARALTYSVQVQHLPSGYNLGSSFFYCITPGVVAAGDHEDYMPNTKRIKEFTSRDAS